MSLLLRLPAPPLVKGGAGSGNFGHAGRPGSRGGSAARSAPVVQEQEMPRAGAGTIKTAMAYVNDDMVYEAYASNATVDEIEAEVYDKVLDVTTKMPISVRAPGEAALQILEDGRFKSQFESGTSKGVFDTDIRESSEKKGLGIDRDSPVEERPIYGYVQVPGVPKQAGNYGAVEFQLHANVKERTTITLGDSLHEFGMGRLAGAPALDPAKESWDARVGQVRKGFRGLEYIEAQVHGGLRTSDIAVVRFGSDAFGWSAGKRPMRAEYIPVMEKAKELGIRTVFDRDSR